MGNTVRPGDWLEIINPLGAEWLDTNKFYLVTDVIRHNEFRLATDGGLESRTWFAGNPSTEHYIRYTKEELLKEADRRFPNGCSYKAAESDSIHKNIESKGAYYMQTNGGTTDFSRIAIQWGKGLVFKNGSWATHAEAPVGTRPFLVGDLVTLEREVTEEEWGVIGELEFPFDIGDEVCVRNLGGDRIEGYVFLSEPNDPPGNGLRAGYYPIAALKHLPIISPGTGDLNTTSHGKINKRSNRIEVQRSSTSISPGEGITGSGISGRRNAATIRCRHLSYKEIIGKS